MDILATKRKKIYDIFAKLRKVLGRCMPLGDDKCILSANESHRICDSNANL